MVAGGGVTPYGRGRMDADVVVVGAGTAGAAAAMLCARRGLRTVLVDRRPLDEAGARWVNGVPAWMFVESGVGMPEGAELLMRDAKFWLVAGRGPERVDVRGHALCEVDMRLLVARLQRGARDAGATLLGEARATAWDGTTLTTTAKSFRAKHVVDASGLHGAGIVPVPRVAPAHLCAAAQEIRRVTDRSAARAFYERHDVRPGDVLAFTSLDGGYSLLSTRLADDHVSILTGSIPADGHLSGAQILARFAAEEPWVGDVVYGGARALPLRRPYDRLAIGKVALLGDAACQVFSAHGSGIGAGLVAARVLADTLAGGGDAHDYEVTWQRRHGGTLAAYDLFRRFSQRLALPDVRRLVTLGLLGSDTAAAALRQEMPAVTAGLALTMLAGAVRAPVLGARLLAIVAKMERLRSLYSHYPSDPQSLPPWSRRVAATFAEAVDGDPQASQPIRQLAEPAEPAESADRADRGDPADPAEPAE